MKYQHEEFIKNKEQKLRMMKEMKGKADFELVNPVCPGSCWRNIPLDNMVEHIKSFKCIEFNESHLKLNTEVKIDDSYFVVYKLEESRDWFIDSIRYVNGKPVFYIMHHSGEETKDVFYYSFKYFEDDVYIKSGTVRCAPMGISPEDAVHNNFTTNIRDNWQLKNIKFTMYKA